MRKERDAAHTVYDVGGLVDMPKLGTTIPKKRIYLTCMAITSLADALFTAIQQKVPGVLLVSPIDLSSFWP